MTKWKLKINNHKAMCFKLSAKYFLTFTWTCQTHEKWGVNSHFSPLAFFPTGHKRAHTYQTHFIMPNNRPMGVPQNRGPIPWSLENWPASCQLIQKDTLHSTPVAKSNRAMAYKCRVWGIWHETTRYPGFSASPASPKQISDSSLAALKVMQH